jgi:hypothetical protein
METLPIKPERLAQLEEFARRGVLRRDRLSRILRAQSSDVSSVPAWIGGRTEALR